MEENETKKSLLQIEIQNVLRNVNNPDSEDFHIWGLTYYSINNEKEKNQNTNLALERFLKAFELDKSNFLACIYIAHCFHDKKEFKEALKYYEKVNQKELKKIQILRYVKLIEQIGYCHFKLGIKEVGRQKFEEVLSWYKNKEIGEMAVPTELIECLDESDQIVKEIKEIEDYLK